MFLVYHIENHPDKDVTIVVVFSTVEKAEAAIAECIADSKYSKDEWCYSTCEVALDRIHSSTR